MHILWCFALSIPCFVKGHLMIPLDANVPVFKIFLLMDLSARKFMPGKNDSANERPSIFSLWQKEGRGGWRQRFQLLIGYCTIWRSGMTEEREMAVETCLQSDIQGSPLFTLVSLHSAEPQVGKNPLIFPGFHSNLNGLVHHFKMCHFFFSCGFKFLYSQSYFTTGPHHI